MALRLSTFVLGTAFALATTALAWRCFGLEASLFVLAGSADYRYSHWLVICTIVTAIGLGVHRYGGGAPQQQAAAPAG